MFKPYPKPAKTIKRKTPLKKVSAKRAKQLKTYTQSKREFLESHPVCQAKLIRCTGLVTDLHHAAGRSGEKLNDKTMFLALCRSCHDQIHTKLSAVDLRAKGLKK